MAYHVEKGTGDIVINGWEKGISDDPYSGIADIRNMNLMSIPKEASVNFSTAQNSLGSFSGSVASADSSTEKITYTGETGTPVASMVVVFTGGSLPGGLSAGTQAASSDTNIYWIRTVDTINKTFTVATDYALTANVNITSTGTGTFATIDMSEPRFSSFDGVNYYAIDAIGRVWGGLRGWVFTGNTTRTNANGNGLVYYQASDGTGYLFAFSNKAIDYTPTATFAWIYGWNPVTGMGGGTAALATGAGIANSHHTIVGQDNIVYICDSNYISAFYEKPGATFNPTDVATFTNQVGSTLAALKLPTIEKAQYLAELGINLLIAGSRNQIYPWDRTSTSFKYPILMADTFGRVSMGNGGSSVLTPNLPKLITVNTNTYIFMGNRGRIYITNGTSAQLYKKIPDHISGTVEPYFSWGDVGFNKNQLYFGVLATTNGGVANSNYGGLWAIDMDTKCLRQVNQLSYGTYAGYCTLFIPLTNNSAGSGFYAGWNSGSSTFGIDVASSTPYTNYQSRIDTDNIPIGLFGDAKNSAEVEWKLVTPLVSGEGVKISYRVKFSDSFTPLWENITVGAFSDISDVSWENAQWLQFRIETKSTGTSPSYTRLTELRLR